MIIVTVSIIDAVPDVMIVGFLFATKKRKKYTKSYSNEKQALSFVILHAVVI